MKQIITLLLGTVFLISCHNDKEISSTTPINWAKKTVDLSTIDSLIAGETYLSVYSQIYSLSEHKTHALTVTVSMRNVNRHDTVYISSADYFDTKGELIRSYFDKPIYLVPMETVEIVLAEKDNEGGTGANFMFDWHIKPNIHEPMFEGVMISTIGSQGLSFTTEGKRIK